MDWSRDKLIAGFGSPETRASLETSTSASTTTDGLSAFEALVPAAGSDSHKSGRDLPERFWQGSTESKPSLKDLDPDLHYAEPHLFEGGADTSPETDSTNIDSATYEGPAYPFQDEVGGSVEIESRSSADADYRFV